MSQHHEQQQERRRLKNKTKARYQAQRRANPVVRSLERSTSLPINLYVDPCGFLALSERTIQKQKNAKLLFYSHLSSQ